MTNEEKEYYKRQMTNKLGTDVTEEELNKFLLMFGAMYEVAEELEGSKFNERMIEEAQYVVDEMR